MNCLVKFCLLLNLSSVFSAKPYVIKEIGYYSCKFPGPRPQWYKDVDGKFKDAQGISSPSDQGYDLAHVLSWAYIGHQGKLFFDELFHDPNGAQSISKEVRKFVNNLAKVDVQAIAPKLQSPTQTKMVPHTKILNQYLTSGKTRLIALNAELITEAMAMWNKIVLHWNNNQLKFYQNSCNDMKKFLKILNSMPANLRYGRKSDNTGIGYNLDPMGGNSNKITNKEEKMAWNEVCAPPSVGQYALKDKTGKYWSCRTSTGVEKMP